MFGLLKGVRVLESAVLLNGGNVGMLLGDLGADVIKLETVGRGDYLRDMLGQLAPHWSPAHLQLNKNKRSLALDLRSDEGRALFFRLLQTVDIFVDGFAGDASDRLGIGYAAQKAVKPDIIYVQYSGYGSEGPYAAIPTHGKQMNALVGGMPAERDGSGQLHVVRGRQIMGGTEDAGSGPAQGAPFAAMAALAALTRRDRTGEGAFIDVAASDGVLAASWIGAVYELNAARIRDRTGLWEGATPEGAGSAKYQLYETADGKHLLFCAIEPKFWRNFCDAIERPDLFDGPGAGPVDFAGADGLREKLAGIFKGRTQAEWVKLAADRNIPMGPSHVFSDLAEDPHLAQRGIMIEASHPAAGPFTYIGYPAIIDGARYGEPRPAPALGEHSASLLEEIGVDSADLEGLQARGIIG